MASRSHKAIFVPTLRLANGQRIFARKAKAVSTATRQRPETVPAEMSGRYIAWSADGLRILGHGATAAEARSVVGNPPGIIIQKIPALEKIRSTPRPAEAHSV